MLTMAVQLNTNSNIIAANAITDKLNEVTKVAESLDALLRATRTFFELNNNGRDILDHKNDGNTSMDESRGSIDVCFCSTMKE